MSLPEVAQVGSGPSDPDPPPDPKALLVAVRSGAVEIDGHLQIDGLDRWLVVEGGAWVLVDVEAIDAVRIDAWTLVTLRVVEPVRGSCRVELPRRGRFTLRPVFCRGGDGEVGLHVGLCAS